jgi:peptide/nickel transport system ATP-binding protein
MSNPQHDYTKLLLDSIPTTRQRWRPRPPRSAAAAPLPA